jgi:hypothetical protein
MYVSPVFVDVLIAFSEGDTWSIYGNWGIAVMYSWGFRLFGVG